MESTRVSLHTLILVRHAHRDTSDRFKDNGLSPRGWEQARALTRDILLRIPGGRPRIVSSPKRRCKDTLELLAQALGIDLEVEPLLDEQAAREDFGAFGLRIEEFQRAWVNSDVNLWVACSHGDWIPAALSYWIGEEIDLKKGGLIELESKDRRIRRVRVVQVPG